MKHSLLPQVDILEFAKHPRECALMLRRQFPSGVRRRLLFEIREWEGVPWVGVYIMEDEDYPNLVVSEPSPTPPRILPRNYYENSPHPRLTLGWRTSPLLDVYSSPLVDRPRRYKNRMVHRATIDTVLKGWVLLRL